MNALGTGQFRCRPLGSASHSLHPIPIEWLTEERHTFFTALHFWNNPEDHRLEWTSFWLMLRPVQKFLLQRQWAGLAPGIRSGTGRGTLTLHCSGTVHFPIVFQLRLPWEKRKENTCHCKAQKLQLRPWSAYWRVKITGTKFLLLKVKGRIR